MGERTQRSPIISRQNLPASPDLGQSSNRISKDARTIKVLVNTLALRGTCNLLAGITSNRAVNRALRNIGLSRPFLENTQAYVPYKLSAQLQEDLAAQTGEEHFGLIAGQASDFWQFGPFSEYVLDGRTLGEAIHRGAIGSQYIWSGALFLVQYQGTHAVLRFAAGIQSAVGARHAEETTLMVLVGLVRKFLGEQWTPDWVELPQRKPGAPLDRVGLGECGIQAAPVPGIAVKVSELQSQNPRERSPETARTFSHLKELAPGGLPKLHKDVVKHIALQKLCCGTLSLDAVAVELDLGPRTLQRRLSLEGTSFRKICNSVIAERAKELLAETDHTVEEIARTLGYDEVNSFRRAFRNHHGTAPSTFRSLKI